jgi:hypothetical protein
MWADSRLGPGREPNRNLSMHWERLGVLEFWSNVRYQYTYVVGTGHHALAHSVH